MPDGWPDTQYARTAVGAVVRPALDGVVETETCVVGGGLAGLATALDLAERGRPVVLLEARRIGWGASGRNGGFVSAGFPDGLDAVRDKLGLHDTRSLYALTRMGRELVRERIARYGIECGPMINGTLECAMAGREADLRPVAEARARDFGIDYEYVPAAALRGMLASPRYADALRNRESFSVHPLNLTLGYASALTAQGGRIYEQSGVTGFDLTGTRKLIRTAWGKVTADRVVFACGGYVGPMLMKLFGATVPVATFVMATEPASAALDRAIATDLPIFDRQFATNYYRRLQDGRLLWGGRVLAWQPRKARIATLLARDMAAFYPDLRGIRVSVAWGGLMSYLRHRMPSFGPLSENVWYVTGFGGLGLAPTSMAGRLVAAALQERDDRWRLFSRFGLPFAGGPAGRVPAQLLFWRLQAADAMGAGRAH